VPRTGTRRLRPINPDRRGHPPRPIPDPGSGVRGYLCEARQAARFWDTPVAWAGAQIADSAADPLRLSRLAEGFGEAGVVELV